MSAAPATESDLLAAPRARLLVLPLATLLGLIVTVMLDLRTPATGPGIELAPGYGWSYALLGPVLAGAATAILRRDDRQGFGWALAWFGAFWGLDGLAQSYVRFGLRADDVLPAMNGALWVLNRLTAFLPVTVAVLLLLFPTGRFLPGRWGHAGRVALAVMCTSVLAVILAPSGDRAGGVQLPSGVDLDAATLPLPAAVADPVLVISIGCVVLGLVVAMASVVARYARSSGVDRDRMRWLLWSVIAMAVLVVLSLVSEVGALRDATVFLLAALPALAMTVAIVDPAAVPIEDLLARTVVYGGLSLAILAADAAALAALTSLLGDSLDQRQVVLVVLIVSVVLYAPVRGRLWALVRRRALGERGNPYDVVAGLASALETASEGADQLAAVARAVAQAFGVRYVSVEVDRSSGERVRATHGIRPDATRTLPITYRGSEVGRLVLPARGLRSRLGRRDQQLLGDLVRQAATAVRTSQLADELQRSRERLVVAREEERRRIRRDLHDGLGPALSGVVYQLETAGLLVDRDPSAARARIQATSTHVQDVVADVRRLVHDLRPPALDDRGLVGALDQQAERLSGSGVRTHLEADRLGPLPAAVEVAAYRIVGEALTNVARHARAGACVVRLATHDAHLVVEVVDDGVGISPDVEAGVGLVSLRERAVELGGRTEITCPPDGGTVVRAWLPMRSLA